MKLFALLSTSRKVYSLQLASAFKGLNSPGDYIVEFNVPLSENDGAVVPSAPEDQYHVCFDEGSGPRIQPRENIDFENTGRGKDWAV